MQSNFDRSLSAVLKHEGGYVDHPADPGGATNMGITFATLRAWRGASITKADVQNLTRAEAAKIYKAKYWDKIKGDDLPFGVDFALFDYAVNSGPGRAVMTLQDIVGVAPDGGVGPITLSAIAEWDSVKLVEKLCAQRLAFLKKLSTWPVFGKGWSRRVSEVLHLAKDMAIALPSPPSKTPVSTPAPSLWRSISTWVKAHSNRKDYK